MQKVKGEKNGKLEFGVYPMNQNNGMERRSRRVPWIVLGVFLGLLLVSAYLFRDSLLDMGFTKTSGAGNLWARYSSSDWPNTDFSKRTVEFDEIVSGGVPRDGIPPIYDPKYVSIESADKWLEDSEPVIVFEKGDFVRAYPLRILIWHEIVNDEFQGRSFIVTFCPLCNSAIVYNTYFDGQNHRFGVSGKLRNSDLIMWDHETETWWQQITGEAIVGKLTGQKLEVFPSALLSYGDFKRLRPKGQVLSQEDTGYGRRYGDNPYVRYDSSRRPFLMVGEIDNRLPPLSRVLGVIWEGNPYTLPFQEMQDRFWGIYRKGQESLIFLNFSKANSSLDEEEIAQSKLVPHITVWMNPKNRPIEGFEKRNDDWIDTIYQLEWNALGEGKRNGKVVMQLEPVLYSTHFAFAWLSFYSKAPWIKFN